MTREEQRVFFSEFVEKQKKIMIEKGDDYANDGDRLINFKRAGAIVGQNAEMNCLHLIAVKVARLGELLGGKTPKNESIEDTLVDGANYFLLLAMILEDKRNENRDQHQNS